MLSRVLKEHQQKQQILKEENELKRKAAISSVNSVTVSLLDSVNTGVAHVFNNQKKIEQETQLLQAQSQKFSKQTMQWIKMLDNFNNALKELGDIENWSKMIENDMQQIALILEYVQKQPQS